MTTFRRFAWSVLACNLAVILWGAFVRASGSGAGCGGHWPLCNGTVLPRSASAETLIELTHRATSGLVLLLVAALAVWALRVAPPGHPVRRASAWAAAFMASEAALGAGLVLFRLVAHDESLARATTGAAHLLNTMLLLAALALAAWRAEGDEAPGARLPASAPAASRRASGRVENGPSAGPAPPAERGAGERPGVAAGPWLSRPDGGLRLALGAGFAGLLLVAAAGSVSALGDTLFPAASLRQGLAQDLAPSAHLLLRLRTIHPFLAGAVGLYLLWLCQHLLAPVPAARPAVAPAASAAPGDGAPISAVTPGLAGAARAERSRRTGIHRVRLLVLGQWALGVLDLGLLAPVWLQLAHLLVADLLWISFVLLAATLTAPAAVRVALPRVLPGRPVEALP